MVKEGWCRIIANFGLISNIGKHRATNHSYKLNFFFKTVVRECEDVQLPLHGLNFKSFAQILKNEIDDSVLVGVIGEVTAIGDLMDVSRDSKPNYKLAIELDDLDKNTLKCTLWGNYAGEMSKYVNEDGRRIVMLQFVKIKVWKGENDG
ncbi:Replication protein A 70 kDa DNA-binding subunit C, partial [Bienertia sinuspersici]